MNFVKNKISKLKQNHTKISKIKQNHTKMEHCPHCTYGNTKTTEERWTYRYKNVNCSKCQKKYYETHYDDKLLCEDCRGGIKVYYQLLPENLLYEYDIPRKYGNGWSFRDMFLAIAEILKCPCEQLIVDGSKFNERNYMMCPIEFEMEGHPKVIFKVRRLP